MRISAERHKTLQRYAFVTQEDVKFIELLAQRVRRLDPSKRAKEEHDVLAKLSKSKPNSTDPRSQYVFDGAWIEFYKEYLNTGGSKLSNLPPSIDNRPIEDKIKAGDLKKDDYYTVNENVARLLFLVYGGGPVMTLHNIEELKRLQESRSQDTLMTPMKLLQDPKSSSTDLKSVNSHISSDSHSSTLYSRPKKTKSSLERRYANPKGWIPAANDILEDSGSIYNCRHRGDSPVGSMDEEEQSVRDRRRNSLSNNRDKSPSNPVGDAQTIKSLEKDTLKGTSSTTTSEAHKSLLLDFIEKSKVIVRNVGIDFPKETKLLIHKKVTSIVLDPGAHKDPAQEDVLAAKYSPLKQHLFKLKLNALENNLVYCYVNSVLQFLFSIPELMVYFTMKNNPLLKGNNTCEEFHKIAEQYNTCDRKVLNATALLNCFKKKLEVHNQQDVDEFLRLLIEQLHQELKGNSKKRAPPPQISNSKTVWQQYCTQEDSVMTYLFTGEIKRKTVCHNCLFESDIRETFDILSLSLSKENTYLEEVIDSNFDPELIDSGYQCSNCKKKAPATSKLFLTKLPRYLVIQLKRFLMFPTACKNSQTIKYGNHDKLSLRK